MMSEAERVARGSPGVVAAMRSACYSIRTEARHAQKHHALTTL
jgi:hypothetical protein